MDGTQVSGISISITSISMYGCVRLTIDRRKPKTVCCWRHRVRLPSTVRRFTAFALRAQHPIHVSCELAAGKKDTTMLSTVKRKNSLWTEHERTIRVRKTADATSLCTAYTCTPANNNGRRVLKSSVAVKRARVSKEYDNNRVAIAFGACACTFFSPTLIHL